MKGNKLTKVLVVMIIILISLISFVGIYTKQGKEMLNVLPEYQLGMNLSGARNVKLAVSEDTNEVIYDSNGNVTTDGKNEDGSLKEGYTKKDEAINKQEDRNLTNYQLSKKVLEKRLKKLGANEYIIRQNNENGEMVIEIPENTLTDEIVSNLTYTGKLEMKDSETDEVLLDNGNIKEAKAVYGTDEHGTTVYLSIEFNKEGKQKLEEISKTYIQTTDQDGNSKTKSVKLELDGETLIDTYFGETLSNGILQLSIGEETTSSEEISEYMKQASSIASLIDSQKMPIQYELADNTYLGAINTNDYIVKIGIAIIGVFVIIGFIYMIVKYKLNGILASISYIGYVALTLLVIRYTNVMISLESIVAMITLLIVAYCMLKYFLNKLSKYDIKQEAIKETYKHFASVLIPLLIIAVVFTFTNWLTIGSVGMLMFWGLVILFAYNYICMKLLLDQKQEKKK